MEIILLQDVSGLGQAGEVHKVAGGYARNYLIPRRLATRATPQAIKEAEAQKASESRRQAKSQEEATAFAMRLEEITLTLSAKAGEGDRLYGAITASDIADALGKELGEDFDKRKIALEEPIKELGRRKVRVFLGGGLEPEITVVVERAGE